MGNMNECIQSVSMFLPEIARIGPLHIAALYTDFGPYIIRTFVHCVYMILKILVITAYSVHMVQYTNVSNMHVY